MASPSKRSEIERDGRGRFAPGNCGGPGRPRGEAEYLQTLTNAVSLDEWEKICTRAAKDALNGDAKARHWLAKYLLPRGGERDDDEMLEAPPLAGRHALHNVRLKCHQKRTR